jgi:hypothetical protein
MVPSLPHGKTPPLTLPPKPVNAVPGVTRESFSPVDHSQPSPSTLLAPNHMPHGHLGQFGVGAPV